MIHNYRNYIHKACAIFIYAGVSLSSNLVEDLYGLPGWTSLLISLPVLFYLSREAGSSRSKG